MLGWLWRLQRNERGQAAVEMALVLPIFILLLFGMTEFGRVYAAYLGLQHAVREGARLGITGADDSAIIDKVLTSAPQLDRNRVTVSIEPDESLRSRGEPLTVRATYVVPVLVPLIADVIGRNSFDLEAEVVMRMER